jgi:hypothetical protein
MAPCILAVIVPDAEHDLRAIRLAATMFLRSPASCQPVPETLRYDR